MICKISGIEIKLVAKEAEWEVDNQVQNIQDNMVSSTELTKTKS